MVRTGHWGWCRVSALVAAVALIAPLDALGVTVYVDDTAAGLNNGTSWCNAYVHLQDALTAAVQAGGGVNEIRVAQGLYRPDRGGGQVLGDRTATLRLPNIAGGLRIRGGYAGCGAANPDARDISGFVGTLSGDLAGNDIGDRFHPSRNENSYHVVTGSGTNSTTVLEGFTITGGRGEATAPTSINGSGAGMFNDAGNLQVIDCVFKQNWVFRNGGAICNRSGSRPTITRCQFLDNSGDFGGAIYNENLSSPVLSQCTISRNTSGWYGAGMFNGSGSSPTLTDCTFTENEVFYSGGGIYFTGQGNASLTRCTFQGNTAQSGAGLYNDKTSPLVVDSEFVGNIASAGGGGAYTDKGFLKFRHCTFEKNEAQNGAGIVTTSASLEATNCLFVGNEASQRGGALYTFASAGTLGAITVSNSTFTENSAVLAAGAVYHDALSLTIRNSILWGNMGAGTVEGMQLSGDPPFIEYSFVEGWSGLLGGDGNSGEDPVFVPGPAGCVYLSQTASGDLAQSPCVDAGSGTAAGTLTAGRTTRTDEQDDADPVDIGFHFSKSGQACSLGMLECRGFVDLFEFAKFENCFTGSTPLPANSCCENFSLDANSTVDLDDFVGFVSVLLGP